MAAARLPHWLACAPWIAGLLPAAFPAQAADPQPYKVEIQSTDSSLDAALQASSDLVTLRKSAPAGPFALIGRARADIDRLKTVLESAGYYQGNISITINGMELEDPALGASLDAAPAGKDAAVKVTCATGPRFTLRHVDIDGELPDGVHGQLGLKEGDPAIAADVLAGGERLQNALQDRGYAFARVDPPVAYEYPEAHVLDVTFHVVAGSKVKVGDITVRGLERTHEAFVLRHLQVQPGDAYNAATMEQARTDLLGLDVFATVSVELGDAPDESGGVPVTFRVRERPRHAVSLNAAYSSDLGGSGGFTWTDRNTTGRADPLSVAASVINLAGTASTRIGYDTSVKYTHPDFLHRQQSLQVTLAGLQQYLEAYDQKALTLGGSVTRKLGNDWSASLGAISRQERIVQESVSQVATDPGCTAPNPSLSPDAIQKCTYNYTLFSVPLAVTYDTTGLSSPLADPTHGVRASVSVAPTLSFGEPNAQFLVTQASISFYFDLQHLGIAEEAGRSVLALRALGGLTPGAGQLSLPPDQRLYAGGSGTIRGYKFQSVGPTFQIDGNPIGGTGMSAGSVELRQRIGASFGAVAFVDAGQVSRHLTPLAGTLRFGAGAGVRYYTPIGPIRLDVAIPVQRRPNDDPFEVYIGLG
ncbi:MAG TPA: BamA/TamA family outer membrane protein, partial [Steroidobacteraceae bacterium]|nr:BamA/TamA family outer membrane protein [Steroidobacteraceae bacterium]